MYNPARPGTKKESVTITADNFQKARKACKAFGCLPYFAIVVDDGDVVHGFVLPLPRLLKLCPPSRRASCWKMSKEYLARYSRDPDVRAFELHYQTNCWW